MTTPGILNLEFYAGDGEGFDFWISDPVPDTDPVEYLPRDLTGAQFKGVVKENYEQATANASFTVTIVGNPAEGHGRAWLDDAQMAALGGTTERLYIYDIEVVQTGYRKQTFLRGQILVHPQVTT